MSTLQRLTDRGLVKPPRWLPVNVQYETIMGSVAYGVSSDASDFDVYGWAIPPKDDVFPHLRGDIPGFGRQHKRFEQFQEHHIRDADALSGRGRTYDFTIFGIVKLFALAMDNNPNVIDSLFTPANCVLHSTRVGNLVRENRRLFLHRGAWPKFKGYAYSQLHKLAIKQPTGKRAELVTQHGYDCYLESETEFLTSAGWKKFDEVEPSDLLAVVSPVSGQLGWETYTERVDKPYSGPVYTVEPAMTRCVVTPNHHMLVSPARRNPATNYSYDYFEDKGEWCLVPFSTLNTGRRSWFHTRRRVDLRCDEYNGVTDEYLALAGQYVSEGSLGFRDGRVKQARITQTKRGKVDFFRSADRLAPAFGLRKYGYAQETVWTIPRLVAERLFLDFGHGSGKKRLPVWAFQLSARQAGIFWSHACLGDGTQAPNGEVYYTSSPQLAADMQAMLTCAGILCSVRGPYRYEYAESAFGNCDMFQVYRPDDQYAFSCVDFKSRVHRPGDGKDSWPIKERQVCNSRIVCFQVPSGTLITRSQGQVALHGNTKFAYHVVRLLGEVEQILLEGDIDLQRDNERLKAIRRGEWTEERLRQWAADKEADLERAFAASKLPAVTDEAAIRTLLLNCLEEHYGNLSDCVVQPDRAVIALRAMQAEIDKVKDLL